MDRKIEDRWGVDIWLNISKFSLAFLSHSKHQHHWPDKCNKITVSCQESELFPVKLQAFTYFYPESKKFTG